MDILVDGPEDNLAQGDQDLLLIGSRELPILGLEAVPPPAGAEFLGLEVCGLHPETWPRIAGETPFAAQLFELLQGDRGSVWTFSHYPPGTRERGSTRIYARPPGKATMLPSEPFTVSVIYGRIIPTKEAEQPTSNFGDENLMECIYDDSVCLYAWPRVPWEQALSALKQDGIKWAREAVVPDEEPGKPLPYAEPRWEPLALQHFAMFAVVVDDGNSVELVAETSLLPKIVRDLKTISWRMLTHPVVSEHLDEWHWSRDGVFIDRLGINPSQ